MSYGSFYPLSWMYKLEVTNDESKYKDTCMEIASQKILSHDYVKILCWPACDSYPLLVIMLF